MENKKEKAPLTPYICVCGKGLSARAIYNKGYKFCPYCMAELSRAKAHRICLVNASLDMKGENLKKIK